MIEYVLHGTSRSLRAVPPGAKVTHIHGREVAGKCEGCGRWLLYGQTIHFWLDGVLTCKKCGPPSEAELQPIRERI